MTSLVQTTDHVTQALSKFLSQFAEKPKIASWHSAFIEEIQQVEDALFDLLTQRLLANATGEQLDVIGKIVKKPRAGLDDNDYRPTLFAWIRANRSSGTADDVLDVVDLAIEGQDADFTPLYPASFVVTVFDALTHDAANIAALIKRARLAGVNAQMVYMSVARANAFVFADGDDEVDSTTQGTASGDDDSSGTGGSLAEVIGA